jgi:hypothetical protein
LSNTIKEQVLERANTLLESKVTDPERKVAFGFDIEEAAMEVLEELHEAEVVILAHELHLTVLPQHERDEPRKLEGWYLGIAASVAERFLIQNPNCLPSPEQREARRDAAIAAKQESKKVPDEVIESIRGKLAGTRTWEKHTQQQVTVAVEEFLVEDLPAESLVHLASVYGISASPESLQSKAARRGLVSFFVFRVHEEYVFVYDEYVLD